MKGYKLKDTIVILLIIAFGLFVSMLFASCQKQTINQTPCNGNCDTYYTVVYENQEIIPNNGYYEITFNGLGYFQIRGQLTELNPQYIINGVPLIEAKFDSDYWVVFDNIQFSTPMYSYLGWFNDNSLNTPIPFGNYTYTMEDLINLHPPHNIAGYQIPKHFCTECPYAETLLGSHSKHNYHPTQNFMLDNEMIGDTINIFIESIFNTDMGESEIITDQLKVIII
tara:strand:+ start:737 stop:1411 length:675 start_codon:yes stop_codon:yes gene_type:complete